MRAKTTPKNKEIIMQHNIIEKVNALQNMSLKELREEYLALFDETAPNFSSRLYLIPRLAYRIQEIYYGGLNQRTKNMLENISKGKMPNLAIQKNKYNLAPGVIIRKEYKGQTYLIKVTDKGYIFNNIHYKSLSQIAMCIAPGSNRSGPRFFGLTEQK